ncbi:N-acetyltransferase [Clostridium gelidum]|uniref:N-acetyltransferase n=1 Tax=Clostridium gelidum TaxID=704125 RepID=A0ABM7T6T7_9CLOT|nr:GNAT family N-acetyltransferase [Clostridium gelidum]BCZ47731.1 N-acetyltransferase [Clostridium gelidum]
MKYFIKSERIGFSVWDKENEKQANLLWGNEDVTKYISTTGKMTEKEILERLDKEVDTYSKYRIQYFPLYIKENTEFIGCCGLRPYKKEKKIAEVGVHLLPEYWGKGYGKEACMRIIKYAFETLSFETIFAGHNPNNLESAKLLKKLGFVYSHDEYYAPTGLKHPSYLLNKEF